MPFPRPRLALLPMNTFGRADEPTIFPAHMMRLSGCSECTRTLACPYLLMNFHQASYEALSSWRIHIDVLQRMAFRLALLQTRPHNACQAALDAPTSLERTQHYCENSSVDYINVLDAVSQHRVFPNSQPGRCPETE